MTRSDPRQRLAAFQRSRGDAMLRFASHAALPVALDPDLLHLIRVNFFLDPPDAVPYDAEHQLLLSSLCSEIGEGLYAIEPDLRDALLQELVAQYGAHRLGETARLLWEYAQRGTPWAGRDGLAEAQLLSALNFVDPQRARAWLDRAQQQAGPGGAPQERWFVALRSDLAGRAAAVEQARLQDDGGLASESPALARLAESLAAGIRDPDAIWQLAEKAGLGPQEATAGARTPRLLWSLLLGAAQARNLLPDLLEAAARAHPSGTLGRAIEEYWVSMRRALRVPGGRLVAIPREWLELEHRRGDVERALRAMVFVRAESNSGETAIAMGFLVAEDLLLVLWQSDAPASGCRLSILYADQCPPWPFEPLPPHKLLVPQVELVEAEADRVETLGVANLALVRFQRRDAGGEPRPALAWSSAGPEKLLGRPVFVLGYPQQDPRIDPAMWRRIFGEGVPGLCVHPGRIVPLTQAGESFGSVEPDPRIAHDCFTASGTGGGPVIDLWSGEAIGIHFAGIYSPGPRCLKVGQALALSSLADHPLLMPPATEAAPGSEASDAATAAPDAAQRLPGLLREAVRALHQASRTGYNQILLATTGERPALLVVAERSSRGKPTYRDASLEGVVGTAFRSGEPVNVPDVSRHRGYIPAVEETRSELAVPVRAAGVVVGVLNAESSEPAAFPSAREHAVRGVAARLGEALDAIGWRSPLRREELPHVQEEITVGALARRLGDRFANDAWHALGLAVALVPMAGYVDSAVLLNALKTLPGRANQVLRERWPSTDAARVKPLRREEVERATESCSPWLEPAIAEMLGSARGPLDSTGLLAVVIREGRSVEAEVLRRIPELRVLAGLPPDEPPAPSATAARDPQRGRWGGSPSAGGRTLSASIRHRAGLRSAILFAVDLTVRADPGAPPLTGGVTFHLHPKLHPQAVSGATGPPDYRVRVPVVGGIASHRIESAYAPFTVGAEADGGRTRLELDLATVADAPEIFLSHRVDELPGSGPASDRKPESWDGGIIVNGRLLQARVRHATTGREKDDRNRFQVVLQVSAAKDGRPLRGEVAFQLPPDLEQFERTVECQGGAARLELAPVAAPFVATAVADGGSTRLELDLSTIDAPARFLRQGGSAPHASTRGDVPLQPSRPSVVKRSSSGTRRRTAAPKARASRRKALTKK